MADALMATYARLPVSFTHGQGAWLWDDAGQTYLDAVSGIAVCNLGHAHPAVRDAICAQAGRLLHSSNLYQIPLQTQLGERLCAATGMDKVFLCNSGAEANEAALKLARLHGHAQGIDLPQIIVMEHSFHGRTLATLSATGNRRVQAGFEPLVQGFVRAPYGDVAAIQTIAQTNPGIVAILVEPLQGEGGVCIPPRDYLPKLRQLCDQHGWLLMLDEIQTGMGRTGKLFAFQHHPALLPDVLTSAKGLGNGVPIGACLAHGTAATLFTPGSHGTTFGGNPLACSAALAVLDIMLSQDIPAQAAQRGQQLLAGLRAGLGDLAHVREVRGLGMMLGIELTRPCKALVAEALAEGLLINVTADNVVRLLPPLILTESDAEKLLARLIPLIRRFV
jgi:acetylornithine aminotransferase